MNESARPRRVKGLGEVSIRVRDLDAMSKFYEEVVGLEVLRRDESFVFFKVAEVYGGHTQNLALFEATNCWPLEAKSEQLNPAETTLHHIALNISLEDFESEKIRLEGLGLKVNATVHEWLHVRSLYFPDPEGNSLEFVCYDESVGCEACVAAGKRINELDYSVAIHLRWHKVKTHFTLGGRPTVLFALIQL